MNAIIDAKEAIQSAREAINLQLKKPDCSFQKYSLLYCNSNENLTSMMSNLIKEGDSVLTVASSGDHYLSSVLYGATRTDIFDINQLTYYFTYFKIASLMILDLEEYRAFLEIGPHLLDKTIYQKVRDYLDSNTRMFFDYIMQNRMKYSLPPNIEKLFHSNFLMWSEEVKPKYIPFLQEDNYKKLQRILLNRDLPNFYRGNVYNVVSELTDTYDVIMFSNISSYQESDVWKNFILNDASSKLSPGGIIQCDYSYTEYEKQCFFRFETEELESIKTNDGQSYRCYQKKF